MATAMQKDKPSALQAALTMEQEPPFPACDARSRASCYVRAAQDALDFVIDLLSLGQPAVTQASPAASCVSVWSVFCACQAVAELIVCGPLLSQLHVLAAPVWLGWGCQ